MANTVSFGNNDGANPSVPSVNLEASFVLDTYAAGGVNIDPLLEADLDFQATRFKVEDIYDATAQVEPNAAGLLARAIYQKSTRNIVLTDMAGAELAAGAITPVTVNLVGFLR